MKNKLDGQESIYSNSLIGKQMRITENFSRGALFVIILTFILFTLALFTHGFTHDLLVEAAVFLVSVKLMLMTYRNSIFARRIEIKLDEIVKRLDQLNPPPEN